MKILITFNKSDVYSYKQLFINIGLMTSFLQQRSCGCYEAETLFIDIDVFLQMTFACTFPRNNETDANATEASLPSLKCKGCKGAFQQTTFSCSRGRILVVICSTGVRVCPGWQLTPFAASQNNQTINSYYSLGPERGAAFYTSLHVTGLLRSSPSDYAIAPLSWRSKITIFRSGTLWS